MPARQPAPKPWVANGEKSESQPMPEASSHFSELELQAWRDICTLLCERAAWRDELRLWAENYAKLLAASRQGQRVNQATLRLHAKDLEHYVANAPPPKTENPFEQFLDKAETRNQIAE